MSARFRFDKFTLLGSERKLLADGQPMALGSRAIGVLLALVERRGAVVNKAELFAQAWPGLVVEDNNLAVQISLLRKVLGQEAIVNVARLGYRFGLPIEELADEPAEEPTVDAEAEPKAERQPASSLPVPPELLIGRETDRLELDALLQQHRLVTVVGPAGVGKTALATVAAHARRSSLRDGAVWIDITAIHNAALVAGVLVQTLRLPATGSEDTLQTLAARLRQLELLIVFDNAEHLAEAVAQLSNALLNGAPGLRILVTSQAALKISSERVFRLEPLSIPPAGCSFEEAMAHGAVALFVDQARGNDRRFTLDEGNLAGVIALCGQLDGLPLAIKLAAARLPVFGVEGLRARLADRFRLLRAQVADLPARHHTLRAALDWSHGLLSPDARRVFRRLAVFAGGFSLELAIAVVQDDPHQAGAAESLLELLVHQSLLAIDAGTLPRYRLLESTRDYARIELEASGESAATHRRHAQAMLALFRVASVDVWNQSDADWLNTYAPEIGNVRIALDWCLKNDGPLGVALLGQAGDLFHELLLFRECRELLAAYAPWASPELPPEVLARYHLERGRFTEGVEPDQSRESSLLAARFYRELGDAKREYIALTLVAYSMLTPVPEAREVVQQQARLEQPDWPPRLLRLRMLGEALTCTREGRYAASRDAVQASLAHARRAGTGYLAAIDLTHLAYCHLASGDVAQAVALGRELVAGKHGRYARQRIYDLGNLTSALLVQGEVAEARERLSDYFTDCRNGGWESFDCFSDLYGSLAASEGRFEDAARLIGYADMAHQCLGQRFPLLAAARERAWRRIEPALEPALFERLLAEGSAMDKEAVCMRTLLKSAAPTPPMPATSLGPPPGLGAAPPAS